jgi:hypothetical protein
MERNSKIRSRGELLQRLNELNNRAEIIEQAFNKEIRRDFFSRRSHVCIFLDIERKKTKAAANELNWLLNE